jgi:ribonucleoside-triphosphate reductase
MASASQQYGGWTCSQIDRILGKYAELSYKKHIEDILEDIKLITNAEEINMSKVEFLAWQKLVREMEQGVQGWEMKFNTVGSSRGDYPFLTLSGGLCRNKFEELAWETILKVRMNGQGKKGFKKPVLFPKLVFVYDENLHEEGKPLERLFDVGVQCSSKTMYPDFLSMTGESYVSNIYKQYGEVISPMG